MSIATPKERADRRFAYALNVPAIALIAGLVAYPVVFSFWISLHRFDPRLKGAPFIGLGNYLTVLRDPLFRDCITVTAYFVAVAVLCVLFVGVSLAMLFNQEFWGRGIARTVLLIPWAIPGVVNGIMWRGFFSKYGALNSLLATLHIPHPDQSWLIQPFIALNCAVAAHVWNSIPFATIVFLAALQSIPVDQYRAAQVDGARSLRRFRHITLPWLVHPILVVSIYQTMTSFRAFDIIFTLTGGGPGRATSVIAYQTYREAFTFLNFGGANAYSYIIMLITMALAFLYTRILYRRGAVQA